MDWQILVTFFQIGYYGNSASLTKIATLIGVRYGIVDQIYHWVITTIQWSNLQVENVK